MVITAFRTQISLPYHVIYFESQNMLVILKEFHCKKAKKCRRKEDRTAAKLVNWRRIRPLSLIKQMPTNHVVADISAFESLQDDANAQMDKPQSPMAVFNAPQDVKDIRQVASDLIQAIDGCLPAFKKYRQAQDQYNQTVKTVSDRRRREAVAIKGNPEQQKTFDREQAAIQDTWRPVVNKLAELQRLR